MWTVRNRHHIVNTNMFTTPGISPPAIEPLIDTITGVRRNVGDF